MADLRIRTCAAPLSRRTLLRAAGTALALPWLDAMRTTRAAESDVAPPMRMVLINRGLGLHAEDFFPTETGPGYALSPYLAELEAHRDRLTVFSGLSHPAVPPGHLSESSFLTAATYANAATYKNTISVDQLAAEQVGHLTRHRSLTLCTHSGSLSWTRDGVPIPAERDPADLFRRLFLAGTPAELRAQADALRNGQSVLDAVREDARRLEQRVGAADRERLQQYFSAVRDAEQRLHNARAWSQRPKPQVDVATLGVLPDPSDIVGRTRMIFDLIHLALQTDSTRLVTLSIDANGGGAPPIAGVGDNRHNLSHHGLDPSKLDQLRSVERAELQCLRELFDKLHGTSEAGATLLDRTLVFYGSNLGDGSSHDVSNLPVLLAGGGLQHGRHLAFDPAAPPPLANLFVSMLQQFGLEVDQFGTSTGTLTGLA